MIPMTKFQAKVARAFTLVEMLVALALTLILVYAIAHFYAILGDSVKDGRSMIEMNQQLRAVVERLKSDFDLVTVPVVPWADEGGAAGYFEIREGAASDADVNGDYSPDAEFQFVDLNNDLKLDGFSADVTNLLGDCDDVIGMTIRAGGTPYTGQSVQVYGLTTAATGGNDGLLVLPTAGSPPNKLTNIPQTREETAPFAEVVWWTSFTDSNPISTPNLSTRPASTSPTPEWWDLNEPRFLHRRQLLIRPDLNVVHPGDISAPSTPYFCRIPVPANNAQAIGLYDLHQYCDVSIHYEAFAGGHLYFVANSLADLCKRQNRFMHISTFYDSPPGSGSAFPYGLDLNPNFAGSLRPDIIPDTAAGIGATQPRHAPANTAQLGTLGPTTPSPQLLGSQYRWVLFDGGRKGEDIMLPNLLAFDIRVYDPEAVLRPDSAAALSVTTGALQPGDPGYHYACAYQYMNTHSPWGGLASNLPTGAYVDIGYGICLTDILPNLAPPNRVAPATTARNVLFGNQNPFSPVLGRSRFADVPATVFPPLSPAAGLNRSRMGFTYDTWTLAYERDGINQDGDFDPIITTQQLIDEGTDGLDILVPNPSPPPAMIYLNGIDDSAERETTPPYPFPLRGVQVRVRMYEPGTRQMRQATVIGDFVSE